MKDKQLIYETLLNEHRRTQNEISDIKAGSFELNPSEKKRIQDLEKKQVLIMNQMKVLFNGNFGK